MRVLVTGSDGFIGKNLVLRLQEEGIDYCTFTRKDSLEDLSVKLSTSDFVVHLAGENRPKDEAEFERGNTRLTAFICRHLSSIERNIPIIFASSVQATKSNAYGISKLNAEKEIAQMGKDHGNPFFVYRLPGVFGKWCKPNYNSVVATFCANIAQNKPIRLDGRSTEITLVYIDDVVNEFLGVIKGESDGSAEFNVDPEYTVRLGDLADQIMSFKHSRESLVTERVGHGLTRKLYATYVSYLSPRDFVYSLQPHGDSRGVFAEMLRTKDSGQVSFFTAKPGITRGGHYHNSKTEKFLVVQGIAKFGFRHIVSGEKIEITTSGNSFEVVETVPGWSHNIKNIGQEDLIAVLWANENFDSERPDTISCKV